MSEEEIGPRRGESGECASSKMISSSSGGRQEKKSGRSGDDEGDVREVGERGELDWSSQRLRGQQHEYKDEGELLGTYWIVVHSMQSLSRSKCSRFGQKLRFEVKRRKRRAKTRRTSPKVILDFSNSSLTLVRAFVQAYGRAQELTEYREKSSNIRYFSHQSKT